MAHIKMYKNGDIAIIKRDMPTAYIKAGDNFTIDFDDETDDGYVEYDLKDVAEVFQAIQKTNHFTKFSYDNGIDVGAGRIEPIY